jgi:hypothetical protein
MSSLRRSIAVLLAVGLMLSGPQGLAAEGADASESPRSSGPLVGLFPFPCADNGPAGPNEARGQSCSWFYELLPAETNATEDFSAYWIQFEIDPGKRFCAKRIDFELEVSAEHRIVSAVPNKSEHIKRAKPQITQLVVDGGGTAPVPGIIEQDVVAPVGRTKVSVQERTYSYRWTGNSRDKIMIAIGIQLAHEAGPPQFFYEWSESGGFTMGSCRAYKIQIATHRP